MPRLYPGKAETDMLSDFTQVTSIVVLYGPRTTALVACDDGVYEFTCGEGNKWFASRERIQIKEVRLVEELRQRLFLPCWLIT